jgi:hypothetical protein
MFVASAKVALLIGNEDYEDAELQGLHAPSNDVAVLAHILTRLGFHVIALHNLTRTEMYNSFRWFCSILPENAYGLLQYLLQVKIIWEFLKRLVITDRLCHTVKIDFYCVTYTQ